MATAKAKLHFEVRDKSFTTPTDTNTVDYPSRVITFAPAKIRDLVKEVLFKPVRTVAGHTQADYKAAAKTLAQLVDAAWTVAEYGSSVHIESNGKWVEDNSPALANYLFTLHETSTIPYRLSRPGVHTDAYCYFVIELTEDT